MLASIAFIYVSLGRAAAFRYEKAARIIIATAVSVTGFQAISEHWFSSLTPAIGWIVAGGIMSLILYRVLLQRGKTAREIEEDKQKDERRWQRDMERWRNEHR